MTVAASNVEPSRAGGASGRAAVPWTNVYGLARSILALGTLVSLVVDDEGTIFRPLGAEIARLDTLPTNHFSLFGLLSGDHLWLARLLAIAILAVVVSGWRPRLTGILHWWVSFSFAVSAVLVEGGDQVAAVITLLLLPVTLTDSREWHWQPARAASGKLSFLAASALAGSALFIIRIQVAAIYFVASTSKLGVPEWRNGTAVYYWLLHPVFGVPDSLRSVVLPALENPVVVTLLTWSVITLEAVLFAGLFMERRYRVVLLPLGVTFHFLIVLAHGLFSFFLAMAGALILLLRRPEEEFCVPGSLRSWLPTKGGISRWILQSASGAVKSTGS